MDVKCTWLHWCTIYLLLSLPWPSLAKNKTEGATPKKPQFNATEAMTFYNSTMELYAAKNDDEWERRVSGFTSEKTDMKVFLDHGGVTFHGEVFYSVANRISVKLTLSFTIKPSIFSNTPHFMNNPTLLT